MFFVSIAIWLMVYLWLRLCYPEDAQIISLSVAFGIVSATIFVLYLILPYIIGFQRILSPI